MRVEAEIGPVVLVMERDQPPRAGDRLKVAADTLLTQPVFVADRALGVAHVSYEQWATFCLAASAVKIDE